MESAGRDASDGVHSVAVGYGTITPSADRMSGTSGNSRPKPVGDEAASPELTSVANERTKLLVGDTDERPKSDREL